MKVKIPIPGTIGKSVSFDLSGVAGAKIGTDLQLPNGTVPSLVELAEALYIASPPSVGVGGVDGEAWPGFVFETQIIDGVLLARVADAEVISGAWQYDADITMANTIAINWLNSAAATIEMLQFGGTAPGGAPTIDPHIGSVVFLMSCENADIGDTTITPEIGPALEYVELLGGSSSSGIISGTQAAIGDKSMFHDSEAGANFTLWRSTAATELIDFTSDFTIEFDVYLQETTSDMGIIGVWGNSNGEKQWLVFVDAAGRVTMSATTNGTNIFSPLSQQYPAAGFLSTDTWYNIAICREGNEWHMFIDGIRPLGNTPFGQVTDATVMFTDATRVLLLMSTVDNSGGGTSEHFVDNLRVTDGVARYTANYTPETTAFDGSFGGTELFNIGDPVYGTVIDGLTTQITSAATDIDGTLNVDGVAGFQSDVDFEADVDLNTGGILTIWDAVDTGFARFSHDQTDFNTVLVATDWNISGVTAIRAAAVDVYFDAIDAATTLAVGGLASMHDVTLFDSTDAKSAALSMSLTALTLALSAGSDVNITGMDTLLLETEASISWLDGGSSPVELLAVVAGEGSGDSDWASVVLLLDFDGADAATVAPGLSESAHYPLTFVANAQLDTAQSKFGTASALFDGTGDYITIPQSTDFDFGSGDFTLECHVRFNGDPGTNNMAFINKWTTAPGRSFNFGLINSNNLGIYYSTTGSDAASIDSAWNPVGEVWYHVAAVRISGEVVFYVDGVALEAAQSHTATYATVSTPVWIGANQNTGSVVNETNGWLDNVRVTKGVGRYTANFTAPIEQYPQHDTNFASVGLLASFDGADAATSFTSEDDAAQVATFVNQAELDDAQQKFGATSVVFDGTGDYVTFPHSAAWDLGADDFTIEYDVRFNGDPGSTGPAMVGQWHSAGNQRAWVITMGGAATLTWNQTTDGSGGTYTTNTASFNPVGDVWYNIAVTRTGGFLYMFVDGALLSTTANTVHIHDGTGNLEIGALDLGSSNGVNGWIDNVRITNGLARYTAAYEPPTRAWPTEAASPAGNDTFVVGDPAVETQLDGEAVVINSYLQLRVATDTELNDITDVVNTDAGKKQGAVVYNTTDDNPVYAVGDTDGAVWVDGAGTTVNTPV